METYLPTRPIVLKQDDVATEDPESPLSPLSHQIETNNGSRPGSTVYKKEATLQGEADGCKRYLVGTRPYNEVVVRGEELVGWETDHEELDF